VKFKEGNKMEVEINIGCSMLIKQDDKDDQVDQIFDLLNQIVDNEDNQNWKPFKKVFMTTLFEIKYDFSHDDQETKLPFEDAIEGMAKMIGFDRNITKLNIPTFSELLPYHFI